MHKPIEATALRLRHVAARTLGHLELAAGSRPSEQIQNAYAPEGAKDGMVGRTGLEPVTSTM